MGLLINKYFVLLFLFLLINKYYINNYTNMLVTVCCYINNYLLWPQAMSTAIQSCVLKPQSSRVETGLLRPAIRKIDGSHYFP